MSEVKRFEYNWAGRPLVIESEKWQNRQMVHA